MFEKVHLLMIYIIITDAASGRFANASQAKQNLRMGNGAMKLLDTILLAASIPCFAQSSQAVSPTAVPTTRILAIGTVTKPLTQEQRRNIMPKEVPDTVRLYLDGKIDQWYIRQDGKGVVFLLNLTSVEEARSLLEKLPLGQAKLMKFDPMPLGPLNPLRLLLSEEPEAGGQKQ